MASFNDKVGEIIRGLGEDEDFVDAVKSQIDYTELVKDALQDEGLKRVLRKELVGFLKSLFEDESEDDGSFRAAVRDEIDFSALVKEALQEESVRRALVQAVGEEIKNAAAEDDNWFSEELAEAVQDGVDIAEIAKGLMQQDEGVRKKIEGRVGEALAESIGNLEISEDDVVEAVDLAAEAKALVVARDSRVMEAISGLIVKDFEGMEELGEEQRAAVWEALGVKAIVESLLSDHGIRSKLEKKLRDSVENEVGRIGKTQTEGVVQAILASDGFRSAVDRIVSDMNSIGRMQDFARGIVERALRESKDFQTLVLAKVQEAMAAKVADQMVTSAFGR